MYYRKHEDNRRHKKVADESSGYPHAWAFDEDKGFYTYQKENATKYLKNVSNRRIRHNKNDYYLTKSNQYHKEFEYWWTLY
jgi:hypothetical protein